MCTKLHPSVDSALCCCAQSSTLALCCTYTLYCVIVHKLVAGFAFESDSILFTQPNKGSFNYYRQSLQILLLLFWMYRQQ